MILCWLHCRELEEECGLRSTTLCQVGVSIFEFIGEPQQLEVHVFSTDDYTGRVIESEGQSLILLNTSADLMAICDMCCYLYIVVPSVGSGALT